jgi:hypothetical protein
MSVSSEFKGFYKARFDDYLAFVRQGFDGST